MRVVLTLSFALALIAGCGSPAKLFQRDTGTAPDPDSAPVNADAKLVLDSATEPSADRPPAWDEGTADTVPSADTGADSAPARLDTSILDAPSVGLDAPMLIPDAETDAPAIDTDLDAEDESRDVRDAFTRDSVSDRMRGDTFPDSLADSNTPANLVVPEVNGTVYSFRFADTVFAVDAAKGARIITFALGGHNLLTAAKDASDVNWGSTLWPSPQSNWSWPPPAEIDSGAYTPSLVGGTLTLSSATASALGMSVTKKFTVNRLAGAVNIEYRISNRGTQSRSVAPWEVSRLAAGGLTFFPLGEGTPSKGSPALLPLELSGGVAWLAYDASLVTEAQKALADGSEGWIAHATGNLLFVKAFGDITPAQAAPGEAEIELYADPTRTYIELEDQGALTRLAPGASLTWTVRWFLRELDASVPVGVGSADLLSTVRALVQSP